jgi:hypothetical protein
MICGVAGINLDEMFGTVGWRVSCDYRPLSCTKVDPTARSGPSLGMGMSMGWYGMFHGVVYGCGR